MAKPKRIGANEPAKPKRRVKPRIKVTLHGASARTAYVALPGHRKECGICAKMLRIEDLVEGYKGPWVNFDFNKEGEMIGIELIVPYSEKRWAE